MLNYTKGPWRTRFWEVEVSDGTLRSIIARTHPLWICDEHGGDAEANARLIAEKGGEYLLQIKANQPALLAQAQALNALQDTPFLSNRAKPTAAVKPAPCTPSPSNPTPSASPTPEA